MKHTSSAGEDRFPNLAALELEDVTGSVWLATALLTYERAARLDPDEAPYPEGRLAFVQTKIKRIAERICAKTVHNARISQWTNGDHEKSTYSYLREVGRRRRLSKADEFEGHRVQPDSLLPDDAELFQGGPVELTYGELCSWVANTYPQLVVPREEQGEDHDEPSETTERPTTPGLPSRTPSRPDAIVLLAGEEELVFERARLVFEGEQRSNVFAQMESKTMTELLEHPRYGHLESRFADRPDLNRPVGEVLAELKRTGSSDYEPFLNKSGDLTYRDFKIEAPGLLSGSGLYTFLVDGEIAYIGQTRSTFHRRFNRNYGRIHPRNCFLDGQSTNCRVNHRLAEAGDRVSVYLCPFQDLDRLDDLEDKLIGRYGPSWNVQGR